MPAVNCPHCSKPINIGAEVANSKHTCPACAEAFFLHQADDGSWEAEIVFDTRPSAGSKKRGPKLDDLPADQQAVVRSGAWLLQVCAIFFMLTALAALVCMGVGYSIESGRAHNQQGVIMAYLCLGFIVLIVLVIPFALTQWTALNLWRGRPSVMNYLACVGAGFLGFLILLTALGAGAATIASVPILHQTQASIYTSIGLVYFCIMGVCLLLGAIRGFRAAALLK